MKNNFEFIYWFAFYNADSPSVRYRAKYPLNYLRNNPGVDSYLVYPGYKLSEIALFLRAYFSALFFRKRNSLIVIQKVHSNFIYANLLKLLVRLRNQNTVYDIDDADYLLYPPSTIHWFCRNCQNVIAGSQEIARNMKQYNPRVHWNTSPAPAVRELKKHKNKVLHIGWIGEFGGDHKTSMMQLLFPAVRELPFPVKLSILGVVKQEDLQLILAYFQDSPTVELLIPQQIDWHDEERINLIIAQFDVGIATLVDNEFHRCKSGFKAKQYLACGVPVLSSDLPENNSFVINGESGFLCATSVEFRNRIIQFNEMSEQEYNSFAKPIAECCRKFDYESYCYKLLHINS